MEDFNWITNPKKLKEFRMRFNVFDRIGNGIIRVDDLVMLLKQMGQTVGKADLEKMMSVIDIQDRDDIHFDEFLMMVSKTFQYQESRDEIYEAFKEFDNGKGFVSAKEIRTILVAMGDKMTEEEVEEMMKEVHIKNDLIRIKDIVTILCR